MAKSTETEVKIKLNMDEIESLAERLKLLISEAHSTMKALDAIERRLQSYTTHEVDEMVEKMIGERIENGVEHYAEELKKHIDSSTEIISKEFKRLRNAYMTGDPFRAK